MTGRGAKAEPCTRLALDHESIRGKAGGDLRSDLTPATEYHCYFYCVGGVVEVAEVELA